MKYQWINVIFRYLAVISDLGTSDLYAELLADLRSLGEDSAHLKTNPEIHGTIIF